MRVIVIPDIHQNWEYAEEILKKEAPYDEAIFLGDYFDAWKENSPRDAYYVAKWLKKSLNNPKHVHLWGNHDLPYAFPYNPLTECPGFTKAKLKNVQEVLNYQDWNKLKFFYVREGWLLTHAGLSQGCLPAVWTEKDATTTNVKKFLLRESEQALDAARNTFEHWIYFHRKGPLWCRPNDFSPIPNLSQIFGHTFNTSPVLFKGGTGLEIHSTVKVLDRVWHPKEGWNVDLDCGNKFYGVLNDGILTFKTV